MKKKIKININGKSKLVNENLKIIDLIKMLKIPLKKVAIELNYEICVKDGQPVEFGQTLIILD